MEPQQLPVLLLACAASRVRLQPQPLPPTPLRMLRSSKPLQPLHNPPLSASAVVTPQAAAQAPSHATPSPLDSNPSPDRAEASLPPANDAAKSTRAPGPAFRPIALSRAEYHAHYAASHPPRGRKNESVPAHATPQAQQPEGAGALTEQPEDPRPNSPPMFAQSASLTSVASPTSFTIVAAA